jgi:cytochrome P450
VARVRGNHRGPWLVAEVARGLGPVRVPFFGSLVSDPEVALGEAARRRAFTKVGPGGVGALVTPVMGETALINIDGPAHRELRGRVRDLFSPTYVEALGLEALAEPLCWLKGELAAGRTVDLVAFMHHLTGRVTCHMLGIDVDAERAAETCAEIAALGQRLAAAVQFNARPQREFARAPRGPPSSNSSPTLGPRANRLTPARA